MDIQVTGRNLSVDEGLREYVRARIEPLMDSYPRLESCHVILTNEKYRFTADIVVQGKDKLREVAQERMSDLYAALDAASNKMDKQLRRSRDKMITRQQSRERLADVEPKIGGEE